MTRYIVTSNALYGQDIAELIKIGLRSKMNLTEEQLYWQMHECYLGAAKLDGITIIWDDNEIEFIASDGIYCGFGNSEQEALQNYLEDKNELSS